MAYSNKEYKTSNVSYTNRDFLGMKHALVEYAKTYFPNTYRDFNETSPGMMLIEMAAYVGDVTNFYIDQQYKEMMLPLAQERRNVVNIAKMLGYKVKASSPSYVTLKVSQVVGVDSTDINNLKPNYSAAVIVNNGMTVQSSTYSDIKFETIDYVDFKVSGSYDPEPTDFDDNGVVNEYTLYKDVVAVAGETKTQTFSLQSPKKFLKLSLSDTDVIEILSVKDGNGNTWYEVDYLAQDKVPVETYWTTDKDRVSAYNYFSGTATDVLEVPVPYSLKYIQTGKRFIVDVDETGTTTLTFGNGVLRNGQINDDKFLQLSQAGMVIPGEPEITLNIDPLNASQRGTLGEIPANTTLTITYRAGGGLASNVSSGDITEVVSRNIIDGNSATSITCTNDGPAYGGSTPETLEEIKKNAMAFFASQNRCVTKEDYEARILNLPEKFGTIAKVYVDRRSTAELFENLDQDGNASIDIDEFNALNTGGIPTLDVYILTYDSKKILKGLPVSLSEESHPLSINVKNYIENYKMITDAITILDGYIINFGIAFEVVAHRSANKSDVKLRCINKIIQYFTIDKMQFRQTLYTSDLVYQLMDIDGVRAVNFVELTQSFNDLSRNRSLNLPASDNTYLFDKDYNPSSGQDQDYGPEDSDDGGTHTGEYGWQYPFIDFYDPDSGVYVGEGIILPSVTPSVFELKNGNKNVRGVVK